MTDGQPYEAIQAPVDDGPVLGQVVELVPQAPEGNAYEHPMHREMRRSGFAIKLNGWALIILGTVFLSASAYWLINFGAPDWPLGFVLVYYLGTAASQIGYCLMLATGIVAIRAGNKHRVRDAELYHGLLAVVYGLQMAVSLVQLLWLGALLLYSVQDEKNHKGEEMYGLLYFLLVFFIIVVLCLAGCTFCVCSCWMSQARAYVIILGGEPGWSSSGGEGREKEKLIYQSPDEELL